MRATFFKGSIRERVGGSLHGLEINRSSRKSGVAGEVGDNDAGDGNELFSGLCLEPVRNPDASRHRNTSFE
jgi:galactose mutarotase-like enzyme